jgi:hypothetical protein
MEERAVNAAGSSVRLLVFGAPAPQTHTKEGVGSTTAVRGRQGASAGDLHGRRTLIAHPSRHGSHGPIKSTRVSLSSSAAKRTPSRPDPESFVPPYG